MIERRVTLRGPLDLGQTLRPLRHGFGDRTIQLGLQDAWLAIRTAAGPATLHVRVPARDEAHVRAWGPGAPRLLDGAPDLLGQADEPEQLHAHHPVVRHLQRQHAGLRLPRTRRIFDALVPSVFEQKITGAEAHRAYAAFLRAFGDPAPGPNPALIVAPSPERVASLPYHALHPIGLERRRAEVLRHAAGRATWLEAAKDAEEAGRRLRALPGIGAWTAAEVVRTAFGDPDAVSVGDYHVPSMVAWALAGEPRADDARMLELLEPYRGQRGRLQLLLEAGRVMPPRRGPRMAARHIAGI
jgi:3-methyladenine DNA glycosylase/8-oxoguanine DNA glycosylase